ANCLKIIKKTGPPDFIFLPVGNSLFMDLRGEVKFDFRVVGPLRIEEPFALGQVYGIAVFVYAYIGVFETGELFQFRRVFTSDPASFEKRQGIELYGSTVFVQEAVLNDFEL